jgi:hypothetical protein
METFLKNNSKIPLTAFRKSIRFPSRQTSGSRPKAVLFFQILGLQIALNLVPTMNGAPRALAETSAANDAKFRVGNEIEFFFVRKLFEKNV